MGLIAEFRGVFFTLLFYFSFKPLYFTQYLLILQNGQFSDCVPYHLLVPELQLHHRDLVLPEDENVYILEMK